MRTPRFALPALVVATLTASIAFSVHAEVPSIRDRPEYADLVERWEGLVDQLGVPGFTVAIVKDGELYTLDAFGTRNVAGDPATPDTMYYIASTTKTYTGLAICQLAERGKLDLDAPVRTYLPQFDLSDKDLASRITIRDLLCHRYGLSSGPIVTRDAYTGQITDEDFFRLLPSAEIAGEVSYSNLHFTILGRVIKAVSGKSWKDYLRAEVCMPAGMDRTTAYASKMYSDANHAEPMIEFDGVWQRAPQVKTDRVMHAAGGMGTTARDAADWIRIFLNGGVASNGTRIVSEATVNEMLTMQETFAETNGSIRAMDGFGLAWQGGTYRSLTPYFQHGGGYIGTAALICFLPEKDFGVVVLSNAAGSGHAVTTIVSIDVLDRIMEVEEARDLLPPYAQQAGRMRAQLKGFDASRLNPASGDALSLPAPKYVGTYSHPDWGTVEFKLEKGKLIGHHGDLVMHLAAGDNADSFESWISPGNEPVGTFDVEGGVVKGASIEVEGTVQAYFAKVK